MSIIRSIPWPLPTYQSGRGSKQNVGRPQGYSNAQMSSLMWRIPNACEAALCCHSWQYFQAKYHSHSEPKRHVSNLNGRKNEGLPGSFFLSSPQVQAPDQEHQVDLEQAVYSLCRGLPRIVMDQLEGGYIQTWSCTCG